MVSITISIPQEVRETMKRFEEVNWSALVRKVIIEEVKKRQLKEELLKGLEREKEFIDWSVELGRKAKKGRFQRLMNNDN